MEVPEKELSELGNISLTRTDFDGNFSFKCPAENCLVSSNSEVGRTSSQWIDILPTRKSDLSGAKAFTVNIPRSL